MLRGYDGIAAELVPRVFEPLLHHPCLHAEDRSVLARAMESLRFGFAFADALYHASCRHGEVIASFEDRGFARPIRQLHLPPRVGIPHAPWAPVAMAQASFNAVRAGLGSVLAPYPPAVPATPPITPPPPANRHGRSGR